MIAIAKRSTKRTKRPRWHKGFLAMLPDITRHAKRALHYLDAEARADAMQEVLANAMLAYVRLHQRGKVNLAYASVPTRFAVAQYHDGRRVGAKSNCKDVLSPYAQRRKDIQVEPLDVYDSDEDCWREVLVEDKNAGPAETAAARIDVGEWFDSLTGRDRRIAEALSEGSTTQDVARRLRLSPARISQKRREFLESWRAFHGEYEPTMETSAPVHVS